jgi:hypothetical protein
LDRAGKSTRRYRSGRLGRAAVVRDAEHGGVRRAAQCRQCGKSQPIRAAAGSVRRLLGANPASRLTALAWEPPRFPDALGQFPLSAPPPRDIPLPTTGLLGGLANPQPDTTNAPPSWSGLLGDLAPGANNKSWSLLGSLDDLAWSPPANVSGGLDSYPGASRELAGPGRTAAHGLGLPSLASPDPIGDQPSGPLSFYLREDLQKRVDPTGVASDQSRTDQVPSLALGTAPGTRTRSSS